MRYPNLEEIKLHLRVTHHEEDVMIQRYFEAAKQFAEQCLNLKIIESEIEVLEVSDNQIALNPAIIAAVLVITADLYEQRQDVVNIVVGQIGTAERLLNKYRQPPT